MADLQSPDRHCRAAILATYGTVPVSGWAPPDNAVDRLRTFDKQVLDDMAQRLLRLGRAQKIPQPDQLVVLFRKVAAAARENIERPDEADALAALLILQVGPYTHDAHALGVILASERWSASHGQPRQVSDRTLRLVHILLFNEDAIDTVTEPQALAERISPDADAVSLDLKPVVHRFVEKLDHDKLLLDSKIEE
jgi:hypothetical protein